ncbi:hypothetical protein PBI_SCTP2_301 [Salicola phage SCTP-2]|nr:hypothetical protein PBI_SCTP2_301 [Salicola phage SCTP-2]
MSNEVDTSSILVESIKYLMYWYLTSNNPHPALSHKISHNDLGYRIHLTNITHVLDSEHGHYVHGTTFYLKGKEYIIEYDRMSMWFTVNENQ